MHNFPLYLLKYSAPPPRGAQPLHTQLNSFLHNGVGKEGAWGLKPPPPQKKILGQIKQRNDNNNKEYPSQTPPTHTHTHTHTTNSKTCLRPCFRWLVGELSKGPPPSWYSSVCLRSSAHSSSPFQHLSLGDTSYQCSVSIPASTFLDYIWKKMYLKIASARLRKPVQETALASTSGTMHTCCPLAVIALTTLSYHVTIHSSLFLWGERSVISFCVVLPVLLLKVWSSPSGCLTYSLSIWILLGICTHSACPFSWDCVCRCGWRRHLAQYRQVSMVQYSGVILQFRFN